MAVSFSSGILWWVRIVLNEFEVQGNSLERIQDYVTIEQAPAVVPERLLLHTGPLQKARSRGPECTIPS
ncbi:hypothetical protein BDV93DRAFT_565892 [Ceratobasidium sp. AG-I]|nr:hypothetical protein BDV93DRAFT_565892 [Ceratobasidium sp. AG-I]